MTLFAVSCAGPSSRCSTPAAPWLALLAVPLPEHDEPVAAVPQPADLGRVSRFSTYATVSLLFWFVGPDSRIIATLRDRSAVAGRALHLRHAGDGPGAARRTTGTATRPRTCCLGGPGGPPPGRLGPHGGSASTSRCRSFPAGTPRSFRPTSSPARSTPAFAMVLDAGRFRSARSTSSKTSSPCATCRTWRKVMLVTGLIVRLRLHHRGVHRLVQRRTSTKASCR